MTYSPMPPSALPQPTPQLPPYLEGCQPASLGRRLAGKIFDVLFIYLVLGLTVGLVLGAYSFATREEPPAWLVLTTILAFLLVLIAVLVIFMRTGKSPGGAISGLAQVRFDDGCAPGFLVILKYLLEQVCSSFTGGIATLVIYILGRDELGRFWFDRTSGIIVLDVRAGRNPVKDQVLPANVEFSAYPQAGVTVPSQVPLANAGVEKSTQEPPLWPPFQASNVGGTAVNGANVSAAGPVDQVPWAGLSKRVNEEEKPATQASAVTPKVPVYASAPVPVRPAVVPVKPVESKPEPVKVEPKPVPVKPEPVKPEPVKVQPKSEPKPVPVKPEVVAAPVPVKPEPVKSEPVKPESKPEPVKVEPKPVPVKPEPVKSEPVKPEPVKSEPVKPESKPEPVKVEPKPVPVKVQPKSEPKPVPVKPESKPEPVKVEPKPVPVKPEPVKSEPVKSEPVKSDPKPEPVKPEVETPAKPASDEKTPEVVSASKNGLIDHVPGVTKTPEEPEKRGLRCEDGSVIELEESVVIGRNPVAPPAYRSFTPVAVSDAEFTLSKTHCVIGIERRGTWIMDLHSSNGTQIRREGTDLIDAPGGKRVRLEVGDVIILGSRRLELQ